jgi:hypoxanthine phosphoribosyltransferase
MTEAATRLSKPSPEIIGKAPFRFRRFISSSVIQEHVRALATRLRADYHDKKPVMVGVLNGAFIFMADLAREMNIPCETDFIKLSSYRDKTIPGAIQLSKDVEIDLRERHVLIIEDIVDTGNSEEFLRRHILGKNPASVAMVAMFVKPRKNNGVPSVEYSGMQIPDAFVVGYGLDCAQQWRHLPDLYVLQPNEGNE